MATGVAPLGGGPAGGVGHLTGVLTCALLRVGPYVQLACVKALRTRSLGARVKLTGREIPHGLFSTRVELAFPP